MRMSASCADGMGATACARLKAAPNDPRLSDGATRTAGKKLACAAFKAKARDARTKSTRAIYARSMASPGWAAVATAATATSVAVAISRGIPSSMVMS